MIPRELKKLINLILLLSLTWTGLQAQIKVTGSVKDANTGEPLSMATVMVKGTNPPVSTSVDQDGTFNITVNSPDDVLEFRFIGYTTITKKVENNSILVIKMEIESRELATCVTIGYQEVKKDDLNGAVTVIDNDDLKRLPVASFDKALQGLAPGLFVSATSGAPGSSATVKLRGLGSMNSMSDPLYVIDDVPLDVNPAMGITNVGGMNPLSAIPPEDIESITILKDASASAIYGARGANGVIIVKTKRGDFGKSKTTVSLSSFTGFSRFPGHLDVMNADQYSKYIRLLHEDDPKQYGYTADETRALNGNINTDWQNLITRKMAPLSSYNMSVSGGGPKSNFSIGGNYYSEDGTLINSSARRYGLRANSDVKVSEWIKVGESVNVSRADNKTSNASLVTALIASPLMPVYNEANRGGFQGPDPQYVGINDVTNPLAEATLNTATNSGSRMLTNVYALITPPKIDGLSYKFDAGYDYMTNNYSSFIKIYELPVSGNRSHLVNELHKSNSFTRMWKINNIVTYTRSLGEKDTNGNKPHKFSLMAGHEAMSHRFETFSAAGQDFVDERYIVMDNFGTALAPGGINLEYRMLSYLGRFMYDYKGKYLITANLRNDQSTKFGPENRSGWFPSFAGAWKFNEDLLSNIKKINLAKLRIGWGLTGNDNFNGLFLYQDHFDRSVNARYLFGTNEQLYYGSQLYEASSNPLLKWESSAMTNFGLDVSVFKSQLIFTADYYIKNQKGMLVKSTMPMANGRLPGVADPWVNLGNVQNRGLELSSTYRNDGEKEGDFSYSIGANFSTYKNKVGDLPAGSLVWPNPPATVMTYTTPGHTIGSFYGYIYEGIFQSDEEVKKHAKQDYAQPGDLKFKDLNGDGVINEYDRTIIGKAIPDFTYGLNVNCSWKGFDFSLMLQGIQNVQIYNATRARLLSPSNSGDYNKLTEVLDYWSPENTDSDIPRIDRLDKNNNSRVSTYFLEDGSFLRLKNIQIGYALPRTWLSGNLNIASVRFYLSASNVYTLTKYKGYDPEIASANPLGANIDVSSYPVPRVYTMGIQVVF